MSELARAAGPVGCLGLALLLLAVRRELRLAGLVAWAAALAALALYLLPDLSRVRLAAAALAGLALAVAGAWVLRRWPWSLAFATLACVPARIPVELGNEEANLLLPLYVVVAALALALAWSIWRGPPRARELGPIAWPLAAFVAWTGVTLVWTDDLREGAIFVGAFVLPFALLAVGFARLPWRGRWLAWMWTAMVAMALAIASIGLYQWGTREIFWNPKVEVGNAYAPFFRVNSIFWDPSIYGRFLVVAILTALAGILLGGVRGHRLAALYLVIAATWFGLLLSYSQSSFAALAAGVVVAALVVWRRRGLVGVGALVVAIGLVALALPQVRDEVGDKSRAGLDRVTSGRSSLVGQGIRIAADNPVLGVGVGGFKRAYADRRGLKAKDPKKAASHATPITVAAEEGFPGLGLLTWLLAAALVSTFRGLGAGFTSRVSFAVGLTLLAIGVHSLFYNAFFEDPVTWALLGLVGLSARVPRRPVAMPTAAVPALPEPIPLALSAPSSTSRSAAEGAGPEAAALSSTGPEGTVRSAAAGGSLVPARGEEGLGSAKADADPGGEE